MRVIGSGNRASGMLASARVRALALATLIHLIRFGVIVGSLEVAAALGIAGWDRGLFANVACAVLAAALMTWRGAWRRSGLLTWSRTGAVWWLLPFGLELVVWLLPGGLREQSPGYAWWAVTLLLVGFNEEVISRGVVLDLLAWEFSPTGAAVGAAVLFGLQHASAYVTGSRDPSLIPFTIVLITIYGFALSAFQLRFRWLWPLILLHAAVDFVSILAVHPMNDWLVAAFHATYLALGIVSLRSLKAAGVPRSAGTALAPARE